MASTPLQGRPTGFALEAKAAALRRPETYPDRPGRIEAVETHMSWVFLAGGHAYKMKKPVRYDFLDFSTLALRRRDCEEEVRLNRRLAPDVYLGTIALTRDAHGALCLGGEGQAIEWLVKMRRLPAERMLDHLIRRGSLREADILSLATTLARFYRKCEPAGIDAGQYRAEFAQAIALNRRELSEPEYELPRALIDALHDAQARFLREQAALLDARVAAGRIVEGHGDLRPEHICLEPAPVVIDCLEFNRRFRIVDPADELAFLAMECARLGAPEVGERLLEACAEAAHDRPPARLTAFYMLFRACLRARFAIGHARELEKPDWPKWQHSAEEYLRLAESYRARLAAA